MKNQTYEVVPGPWSVRVWRPKHKQFGRLKIRISRPGPARSHKWRIGPMRVTIAPSVGTLKRAAREGSHE